MISRAALRPTYPAVVSTLALVVALGGGAYAAVGIPDKAGTFHGCVDGKTGVLRVVRSAASCHKKHTAQVGGKRVVVPAERAVTFDQSGRSGAKGDAGPSGAKGDPGPAGAKGDPGPVDGTLPSGATEMGSFAARAVDGASVDSVDVVLNFALRPALPMTAYLVFPDAPGTPCQGSAAAPTAPRGTLCVYLSVQQNLEAYSPSVSTAPLKFIDPATTVQIGDTSASVRPYGLLLRANAAASGDFYAYGTWALTVA